MTTRELTHVTLTKQLQNIQAAGSTASQVLDTQQPWASGYYSAGSVGATGSYVMQVESAAIMINIANGNLGASITYQPVLEEADASGGPFTAVDPLYQEWFQDGVPGSLVGGIWTPSIPGGSVAPILNSGTLESHTYVVSYVGGLHRYLRIHPAVVGAPTNLVSIIGMLGALAETFGKIYSNFVS